MPVAMMFRRSLAMLVVVCLTALPFLPGAAAQGGQPARCTQVTAVRFYWHYDCVEEEFQRIQDTYPDLASFTTIGESVDGNPIFLLKVANATANTTGPRPAFYLDATHHGNEIQGTEGAMILARKLVEEYGSNETVTRWVDEFDIYINPVVNPDGNKLNQRHNRNSVDLNRNYPFECGVRASSYGDCDNPEPEVRANVAFMRSVDLDVYASLHTGSWDYVSPRCDAENNQERAKTDDEELYDKVFIGLFEASGRPVRGASGTGESICWSYDITEVFSILPEMANEQGTPFTASDTEQLNAQMNGIYWLINNTGRFGATIEGSLVADNTSSSGLSIRVENTGLQGTSNWTLTLNRENNTGPELVRGNQKIASGANVTIPIPKRFVGGETWVQLKYDHLNVNPLLSDPETGLSFDPYVRWLNFTQDEAKQVIVDAGGDPDEALAEEVPGLPLTLVAPTLIGLVLLRRRRRV